MKRKIIAIIACILVAGTAGVSAKTITSANAQSTVANTVSTSAYAAANKDTTTNSPTAKASVQPAAAAATKNCPLTQNAAANSTAAPTTSTPVTNQVAGTANNTASSSCPFNYVNGVSVTNCPTSTKNCINNICLKNPSNCTTGQICTVNAQNCAISNNLAAILNNANYKYVIASGNCKNGSTNTTVSKPSASSAPAASSKPSTSTAPSSKPASSTAPSTAPQSGSSFSAFQNQVIQLVNEQRAANGLKPLTANAQLTNTATLKSQDMAKLNYFDHTSPTYGSPFDMMKKYDISYRTAGENIAMGQTTPAQVMQGWMNSPGHRANILNASFTQIGVGIAKNAQGQLIWTQQFIG